MKKAGPPVARQQVLESTRKAKVSPLRNLTPELCDCLRGDLPKACQDVAEIHGLIVEGGDLNDIDLRHGFDIGFRGDIPMEDGALYSSDKAMFGVLTEHFELKPWDYSRAFKARGETIHITAINPNRPKYPICLERVADGRGFKFPVEKVVLYLRNAGGGGAIRSLNVPTNAQICNFGPARPVYSLDCRARLTAIEVTSFKPRQEHYK